MALIKLTAIVDNISGKLSGTVFARNKGGHYMRSKSKPTNPRTSAQMAVRAVFGGIAQSWRNLSQAARNAWNAAAADFPYQNKLGDSKILSGFGLHQKFNTNLSVIGKPLLTMPPEPQGTAGITTVRVTAKTGGEAGEPSLTATLGALNPSLTNQVYVVKSSGPISAGVENANTRLRVIATPDLTVGAINILSGYVQHFGELVVGQKISFSFSVVNGNTGEASPEFIENVEVTV